MKRCFLHHLLLTTFGCVPAVPPAEDISMKMANFPLIDPDDPATIARWEASRYNFGNSKISVVELRYLHGVLGDSTPKEPQSVAVQVYGAKDAGIAAEQQAAINRLGSVRAGESGTKILKGPESDSNGRPFRPWANFRDEYQRLCRWLDKRLAPSGRNTSVLSVAKVRSFGEDRIPHLTQPPP